MLVIKMAEDELQYFNELINEYSDYVLVKTEHGFDMNISVQLVIDISDILEVIIPSVLTGIELVLLHRVQKRQLEVSEKEVALHEEELKLEKERQLRERNKDERNEFEVRLTSAGKSEILVRTSDIRSLQDNPEYLQQLMNKIKTIMGIKHESL